MIFLSITVFSWLECLELENLLSNRVLRDLSRTNIASVSSAVRISQNHAWVPSLIETIEAGFKEEFFLCYRILFVQEQS